MVHCRDGKKGGVRGKCDDFPSRNFTEKVSRNQETNKNFGTVNTGVNKSSGTAPDHFDKNSLSAVSAVI